MSELCAIAWRRGLRRIVAMFVGLTVLTGALVGLPSPSSANTSGLGWNLSNWFGGTGDMQCAFGQTGDQIVAGDWDADGQDGPGVFRNGVWYLSHFCGGPVVAEIRFGQTGDIPVVGDWDGNGTETIGVWRQGNWFLSNDFTGYVHHAFTYGTNTDTPVVGDWDGNSTTTVGVFRGDGWWHLTDALGGNPNHNFAWGATGDVPLIGDWNGDRKDSPGFRRGIEWNLTNNLGGAVDARFVYGPTTDRPIVGDWDGNGTTTPGIVSSSSVPTNGELDPGTTAHQPDMSFTAPGPGADDTELTTEQKANPTAVWWVIRIVLARTGQRVTSKVVQRATYEAAKRAAVKLAARELNRAESELNAPSGQRLLSLTQNNFRENVRRRIDWPSSSLQGYDVHHTLPVKFSEQFRIAGINIHNPVYGHPWCASAHRSAASAYNSEWESWLGSRTVTDSDQFRAQIEAKRLQMVSRASWASTYQCT